MKPICCVAGMLIMLLAAVGSSQRASGQTTSQEQNGQQSQVLWGGTLYDDFNHRWIDPVRWAATPEGATPNYKEACYFSTSVLECVRELQNGKLRLAVRSAGSGSSNDGSQYGESKLLFTPQSLKSITVDVVVQSSTIKVCPANVSQYFAAPQAMITASFFNSGSGKSSDNVSAMLTIAPSSPNDPKKLFITGFLQWPQGTYFGHVTLGSVPIGTPVRASMRWNQASHKFVVSFLNLITHEFFTSDIPYNIPDVTAPSGDWKGLYVQAFPSNCIGEPTWEGMEATFDNVIVSH